MLLVFLTFTLLFFSNLTCVFAFTVCQFFIEVTPLSNYSLSFWWTVFRFGGVGTALAYILWNKGVQLLGVNKAGIYTNIVPLATAIIVVMRGEELTTVHLISWVFIITGLLITQIGGTKRL